MRGSGRRPVADYRVEYGQRISDDPRGDRRAAGHNEGVAASPGRVAGVGESAEVDFVAVLDSFSHAVQRAILSGRCAGM